MPQEAFWNRNDSRTVSLGIDASVRALPLPAKGFISLEIIELEIARKMACNMLVRLSAGKHECLRQSRATVRLDVERLLLSNSLLTIIAGDSNSKWRQHLGPLKIKISFFR